MKNKRDYQVKKIQIIVMTGVLCCSISYANDGGDLPVTLKNKINTDQLKKNKSKKKDNLSLVINTCLRALEEAFKGLLEKEITHVLVQLPKWIDRLGSRSVMIGGESEMMPQNILSILEFVKNKWDVNRFFEESDSYLQKLWQCDSQEARKDYLTVVLLSCDEAPLFLDELFHVLSASLTKEQQVEIQNFYNSFDEDGTKVTCEIEELEEQGDEEGITLLDGHED